MLVSGGLQRQFENTITNGAWLKTALVRLGCDLKLSQAVWPYELQSHRSQSWGWKYEGKALTSLAFAFQLLRFA